jgi:hypothetical protein
VFAGVLAFESSGVGGIAGVWAGVGITGVSGVGIIPSEVNHSELLGETVRPGTREGSQEGWLRTNGSITEHKCDKGVWVR